MAVVVESEEAVEQTKVTIAGHQIRYVRLAWQLNSVMFGLIDLMASGSRAQGVVMTAHAVPRAESSVVEAALWEVPDSLMTEEVAEEVRLVGRRQKEAF